jgi:hypothetical protein
MANKILEFPSVFPMSLRGSDAAERRGATWALSTQHDHPGAVLYTTRNRVSRGTTTVVGIQKQEVGAPQILRINKLSVIRK